LKNAENRRALRFCPQTPSPPVAGGFAPRPPFAPSDKFLSKSAGSTDILGSEFYFTFYMVMRQPVAKGFILVAFLKPLRNGYYMTVYFFLQWAQ